MREERKEQTAEGKTLGICRGQEKEEGDLETIAFAGGGCHVPPRDQKGQAEDCPLSLLYAA